MLELFILGLVIYLIFLIGDFIFTSMMYNPMGDDDLYYEEEEKEKE